MSFGLRIPANGSGAVFDTSLAVDGYALVDAFRVVGTATGSRSYPELAGFTVYTNEASEASENWYEQYTSAHNVTVSYTGTAPDQIPVVNYTPAVRPAPYTLIYVFAR